MGEIASIDLAAMSSLISAMNNAATNLPYDRYGFTSALGAVDVDASPSQKLVTVANWADQEIPGLRRRLALAQAIEASQPSFQTVVQIDESDISTTDPTTAQNLGASDAKRLKDTNGAIDAALLAEIAKNQNDPYFAAGLAQNITPTELAHAVTNESNQRSLVDDGAGTDYRARMDAWKKNYGDLLSAVGGTLATATRNTGDLALPTDYGKQWTDAITADVPSQGGDGAYGQGAALSLLLTHGSFSTAFLGTVSTGVYDYERGHEGDGPLWKPRSWAGSTFQGVNTPDGSGQVSDPLAGIMTALSHNPDAAQNFFDVGNANASTATVQINGKDVPVNARLKYLIQDRTWASDIGSDNGSGLGAALQAASTFYRTNDSQGQISATIASQAFAAIGTKTGEGKHDSNWYALGLNGADGWKMWAGMRGSVANMVASYSPDLMRVAGTDDAGSDSLGDPWTHGSDNLFPPNGPLGAKLNRDLMAKILGTLGEDPKNIDIVTAGVAAAGQLRMSYALQQALQGDPAAAVHMIEGSQYVDLVNGASNELAGTMAFVINKAYKGDASNQEFQKKQAEALSKAMGIALGMPFLAVPEGRPWTGFIIDQAKDIALDKIGEGPDQDAKGTYNDTATSTQQNLQHAMLNDLLANGYLDKEHYDQAGPAFVPPPAAAMAHDDKGNLVDPPQFDFSSPAYLNWERQGHNLQPWINTNVIDPFRDKFPALGAG